MWEKENTKSSVRNRNTTTTTTTTARTPTANNLALGTIATHRTVSSSSTIRQASYRGPGGVECVVSLDLGRRRDGRLFPNILLPSKTTTTTEMSTTTPSFESSSSSSSNNNNNGQDEQRQLEELEHTTLENDKISCQLFRHDGSNPLSSFSSGCSLSSQQQTQHKLQQHGRRQRERPRFWMSWVWRLHLLGAVLLIVIGISHKKGSKKYIPVSLTSPTSSSSSSSTTWQQEQKSVVIDDEDHKNGCRKGFINVMAESSDEEGAFVCCDTVTNSSVWSLCPMKTKWPPLAGRLNRFPDAWILPLCPILLRLVYFFYEGFLSTGSMSWELLPATVVRRLGLYLVLLMTRGWVLYVAFNAIEDRIVGPLPGSCWYRDWLPMDPPTCHGRVFDFSDHMVLYFAQILPVALLEVLHALEHPYWNKHTTTRLSPYSTASDSTAAEVTRRLVPVTLIGGMMYLYFITFLGVYKTATYFHTGSETVTGFAVSLLIHVPLQQLQCSDRWERLREYFFATTTSCHLANGEKNVLY